MNDTRFGRNVVYSAVSWLVPAVVLFVAVPITVHRLGPQRYGVMALVGAIAGYIGVLDLGLGQGIVRYLAVFVSGRQGATARECLKTVLWWFAGVGILGAVSMWVLAPWLAGTLLKVPPRLVADTISAFRIGALAFALGMVGSVFAFIPEAFLRYDLVSLIGTTLACLSGIGPAVLVTLGYGLLAVIWFDAAIALLACVTWGVVGFRLLSTLPPEGPTFREHRRGFLGFSSAVAANRIWSAIQAETSKVVVGAAAGLAQAAYFQLPNMMTDKFRGLLGRMSTVLLPTASQLHAAGEHGQLIGLYKRSARLFYLLNASVTGALVVFAVPLLTHWLGPQYGIAGGLAFTFLALASGINSTSMSAGSVNLAMGRPRVNLAFSLINSFVNLGTVYFFTVWWGIAGTAASGLLAALDVPFFLHYSHRRVMHVSTWEVFRTCYARTTIAVVAVGAVAWFVLRPLASSIWATLALVAVTAAAGLLVSGAFGAFTSEDRESLKGALRFRRSGAAPEAETIDGDESDE